MVNGAEATLRSLLEGVGITPDGDQPHDPQIHDPRFYRRVLQDGSLGFGESYMDGWWDVESLDGLVFRLLTGDLKAQVRKDHGALLKVLWYRLLNPQSLRAAPRHIEAHYEIGLDLFQAMLDPTMAYSCAYWQGAETLEEAQEAKLDLICRKLQLTEGMRLLDIGCGWGSLVKHAAERYGVKATGITLSAEQAAFASEVCRGLPVEIRVEDYRAHRGVHDAVASVGMFEHVGPRNYRTYMEAVDRSLAPGGISLLHTIAGNERTSHADPWLHRYIFPGSNLPTLGQIGGVAEGLFLVEDVHNFGPHYDLTLLAWHQTFERAWPELKERYSERFRRMWNYYLLSCAAAFRARYTQLFQVVLSRPGDPRRASAYSVSGEPWHDRFAQG